MTRRARLKPFRATDARERFSRPIRMRVSPTNTTPMATKTMMTSAVVSPQESTPSARAPTSGITDSPATATFMPRLSTRRGVPARGAVGVGVFIGTSQRGCLILEQRRRAVNPPRRARYIAETGPSRRFRPAAAARNGR